MPVFCKNYEAKTMILSTKAENGNVELFDFLPIDNNPV